jgi:hypothetical protein
MPKIIRTVPCFLVLYLGLSAGPAWGVDYHLGMDVSAGYKSHANYLDRGSRGLVGQLHFTRDRSYGLVSASPYLSFSLHDGVDGYIQADIDWENSDDPETGKNLETDLGNAYLSLSRKDLRADLGLQTVALGNGRIMDDDVPAAALNLDSGQGYLQLVLAQVLDSSPMVAATMGYHPGYLEKASLFGIWFDDRDDAFAHAIPPIYQTLLAPRSEGDLYWAGASVELFLGKALFSAVAAYQWGRFRLYNETASSSRNVSAYLADLSLEGNLADWCSLGAFVFAASGDDTPLRNDLKAFVAIRPFNPRAAIFFDPEFLGRDAQADRLTFSGGFFGGVIAPGLTLNLASASGLALATTLASFYAQEALDDGSQWYGWELDLDLNFTFARIYTLYAEAARFQHGDYYEALLDEKVDPAVRLCIGLRASF